MNNNSLIAQSALLQSIYTKPFVSSGDLLLSAGKITMSYDYGSNINALEDNPKPYVTDLSITNNGTGKVGDTFTCNYTFVSPSGYAEAGTTFQWVRLNERGEFVENIVGATSQNHVGVVGDEGYRLGCIVTVWQTAIAPANGNANGLPVMVETEEVVLELDVTAPVISNFEIRPGEHNRIYFESSEIITATGFANFTLEFPTRTIIAININEGQLTDHYLTVSADYVEGGGGDIRSSGGDIFDASGNAMEAFLLTAISNNVDTSAPVGVNSPDDSDTGVDVTGNLTRTYDEPIRNTDGSEITNANVGALITLKETDAAGADIPFTATINAEKTVITIDPTSSLPENSDIYLSFAAVEDNYGNETADPAETIVFATGGAPVRTLLRTFKFDFRNNSGYTVAPAGYNTMNGTNDDNGDTIALNRDNGDPSDLTLTNLGDWSSGVDSDDSNATSGDLDPEIILGNHKIGANTPDAVGKIIGGADDTKSYVLKITSVARASDTTNYNTEFKVNDINGDKAPVNIDPVAQKAAPSVVQIATNIHSDGGLFAVFVYEPGAFQAFINSGIIEEYNIDE